MNKKAFIQNTMKRLSFDNEGTFVYFVTFSLDPRYDFNVYTAFKFSWFLGYIVLNLFLFFPNFLKIFHNTIMIYNNRNWSNDTTESQKEKRHV